MVMSHANFTCEINSQNFRIIRRVNEIAHNKSMRKSYSAHKAVDYKVK